MRLAHDTHSHSKGVSLLLLECRTQDNLSQELNSSATTISGVVVEGNSHRVKEIITSIAGEETDEEAG